MDTAAGDRSALAIKLAPFIGTIVLAWLSVIVGTTIDWSEYAIATVLVLVAVTARVLRELRPRLTRRLPHTLSSLIFLLALALLRESAGGASSGIAILALVPVFYTALYSSARRDLLVVLGGMAAVYLVPIIAIGAPSYPQAGLRSSAIVIAISSVIGLTTQRLVADVRHRADEAVDREHMLEQVSDTLRGLFRSGQGRIDVCNAAMAIGDASTAIIYEPSRPGFMRCTAIAGIEAEPMEISIEGHNGVRDAFDTGIPILITEDIESHVGNPELWRAAGMPASVLYEPLLRGNQPIGVLVVSWPAEVGHPGTRATIVSLLAHEAAVVIDRSDLVSELTDMSQTDPLTGILNRRAWDAGVEAQLRQGAAFTIAIIDLDLFKAYNDTHGHPAGDRLLREVAAAWRETLRSGDVLARIGGEEFGLLMPGSAAPQAREVIERLRALVPYGQTCSAGFAVRRRGESAEGLMARADAALYEAKANGRDRARMSA
ncbi:MAG TPA: sensor domain-containing diguanylate cyclase [Solirubrobacteraceae bacterium]|nr:sensor domain-containing diguanylate cyclase [Solirubrobacteraceae bacterium]